MISQPQTKLDVFKTAHPLEIDDIREILCDILGLAENGSGECILQENGFTHVVVSMLMPQTHRGKRRFGDLILI